MSGVQMTKSDPEQPRAGAPDPPKCSFCGRTDEHLCGAWGDGGLLAQPCVCGRPKNDMIHTSAVPDSHDYLASEPRGPAPEKEDIVRPAAASAETRARIAAILASNAANARICAIVDCGKRDDVAPYDGTWPTCSGKMPLCREHRITAAAARASASAHEVTFFGTCTIHGAYDGEGCPTCRTPNPKCGIPGCGCYSSDGKEAAAPPEERPMKMKEWPHVDFSAPDPPMCFCPDECKKHPEEQTRTVIDEAAPVTREDWDKLAALAEKRTSQPSAAPSAEERAGPSKEAVHAAYRAISAVSKLMTPPSEGWDTTFTHKVAEIIDREFQPKLRAVQADGEEKGRREAFEEAERLITGWNWYHDDSISSVTADIAAYLRERARSSSGEAKE